jgi:antitoxin component YwqK of YwqJK toxin-antitoxin module
MKWWSLLSFKGNLNLNNCINRKTSFFNFKSFAFIVFSAIQLSIYSQTPDTLWNQLDNKGQRQGFWKSYYDNGKIKYRGFFKNNIPVGEFYRYYDDGSLQAIQKYSNTNISYVTFFYPNGNMAAEGKYVGKLKDSTWKYYSYYDKTLRLEEQYVMGKKNGKSIKYYPNHQPAEIVNWVNDKKEGEWIQYFDNGKIKLQSYYRNDKRDGDYKLYRPDGTAEIYGFFANNLMEGVWIYYNEQGKESMRIKYSEGVPLNATALDSMQNEIFKTIDANKGKIPEPTENDLVPGY